MIRLLARGFTLVEVLVVVAIIVVLLALLMPALDRAVYQAELVRCGAGLHGMGLGLGAYSFDHKRFYPQRAINGSWQPAMIRHSGASIDNRSVIAKAFSLKMLLDPLTAPVNVEQSTAEQVFAPYNVWIGWNYWDGGVRQPGMRRVGDRFEWRGERFSVLLSDRDLVMPQVNEIQSSHPDRAGRMTNLVADQSANPWGGATAPAQAMANSGTFTISLWWLGRSGGIGRGPVDNEYLHDDLSVRRYDDVGASTSPDERMAPVPIFAGNTNIPAPAGGWIHLPKP